MENPAYLKDNCFLSFYTEEIVSPMLFQIVRVCLLGHSDAWSIHCVTLLLSFFIIMEHYLNLKSILSEVLVGILIF